MNTKSFKKLIPVLTLLLVIVTMSSCNRGVGCPSDFSLLEGAIDVIKCVPSVICDFFCK